MIILVPKEMTLKDLALVAANGWTLPSNIVRHTYIGVFLDREEVATVDKHFRKAGLAEGKHYQWDRRHHD